MAENIIIEISADAQKLTPVIDQLVKLGQVSAKDAEEFKKIAVESAKMATETKKAAVEAKVLSDNLPGGKANPKPSQETEKTSTAFKSLKTQLSEAKTEAARLAQEMGQFSPQAIEAAKRAAIIDDRMKDLNKTLAALNPEQKLGAFLQLGTGIAGAFTAAQGAAALFGEESEDVQKALLKVQAALALTQGLQSVLGLKDAFSNLRILLGITTTAQAAFNASQVSGAAATNIFSAATARLNAVMLANPIGIVVAALGTLVAVYYAVTRSTERATAVQEAYNKALEQNVKFDEAITESQNKRKGSNAVVRDLERQIKLLEGTEAKTSEIVRLKLQQNEIDLNYARILRDNVKGTEAYNKTTQDVLDLLNQRLILQKQLNDAIKEERPEDIIPSDTINGIQKLIDDIEQSMKPINDLPNELGKRGNEASRSFIRGFGEGLKDEDLGLRNILAQIFPDQDFTKEQIDFIKGQIKDLASELEGVFLGVFDNIAAGFEANAQTLQTQKEERLEAFDEEEERLIELNNNKIISDGLYAQKQKELAKQREATERELNKKIADEKRKAFVADRVASVARTAINTAEGITKVSTTIPFPASIPFIAALAALGALQTALILSQPIPKFKKGVIGLKGQGTETSDSIPAMLSRGESVMTAQETKKFEPTLLAIRKNRISPELLNAFSVNHNFGAIEASIDTGKLTRSSRKLIPHQADAIGRSVAKHMKEGSLYSPIRGEWI